MTNTGAMDKDKPKSIVRRPDVSRRLNAENLRVIENGLLGQIPKKLRPQLMIPVRGNSTEIVKRETGFLSSCLPVIPHSPLPETPTSQTSSDDEGRSPLKKSFSFRDRLTRISFFNKEKDKMEKPKWKAIVEDEANEDTSVNHGSRSYKSDHIKADQDIKTSKRFWFFRNKEIQDKKHHRPIYLRSKSFEFLPRAVDEEKSNKTKKRLKNSLSYVFGSSDSIDTWVSNESLEHVYFDQDDGVFLKTIKESRTSESSTNNSSMSLVTSTSSGIVINILKTQSVQDIMEEFNRAVDMFSESYLSDCEPYTKGREEMPKVEKRKSSSFNALPSPKVLQVNKVSEISEDFKEELSKAISKKSESSALKTVRRGSVTDWFVLEDQTAVATSEENKYRRAKKKPVNRVRRISSTKYIVTTLEFSIEIAFNFKSPTKRSWDEPVFCSEDLRFVKWNIQVY